MFFVVINNNMPVTYIWLDRFLHQVIGDVKIKLGTGHVNPKPELPES